ncbi:NusG domain II-containing protein [Enterococcus sp. LJL120]|uniref:NusG domain II-containing protein n=1 Tax=Enterococcus sp. HY326 TaxID=2971265 RepID=UPI00223FF43C|nr:NusG domain II-containing protein [Enterococcus sp. HY326]
MKFKEFARKSFLKPWDLIIIFFLFLLSFTPIVIFGYQQNQLAQQADAVNYQAVLKVDGVEIRSFDLTADQASYTYTYEDEDGDYNIIEIDGERVRISEANCGDQICVRQGWISKAGQSVVCLPHRLVLEIQASDGSEDGALIY